MSYDNLALTRSPCCVKQPSGFIFIKSLTAEKCSILLLFPVSHFLMTRVVRGTLIPELLWQVWLIQLLRASLPQDLLCSLILNEGASSVYLVGESVQVVLVTAFFFKKRTNISHLLFSQGNISLRAVDLSFNGFGKEGAVALGQALKENNALEELNVRYEPTFKSWYHCTVTESIRGQRLQLPVQNVQG